MNKLRLFQNDEFGQVRTLLIDNEPYFVGRDEIVSSGGHRGYITRISSSGDIEAISCYNGGALIIDRKWIGNTWNTTGHRHNALAKVIKEITCNTQRTR